MLCTRCFPPPAGSAAACRKPLLLLERGTRHAHGPKSQSAYLYLPYVQAEERGGSLCARSPLTSNPQSGRMLRSLLAAATDAFACRVSSSGGSHVFGHLAPRRPPMLTAHRSSRRRMRHACGYPLPCTRWACGHVVRASGAVRFSSGLTTPLAQGDFPLAFPSNTGTLILYAALLMNHPACPAPFSTSPANI